MARGSRQPASAPLRRRSIERVGRLVAIVALGGAPNVPSMTSPPFTGLSDTLLAAIEPSLEPSDLFLLTTGATGAAVTSAAPDTRIANYANLPNRPFQLTGPSLAYDTYTGDTAHRFYQMWQQSDCSIQNATEDNPTGCLNDLYPFVITTYGGPTADHGGGTSMAFYNIQNEDAPLLKKLADVYTISDNYHQPAQGGTGMQHAFLGTGDDFYWSDGNGNPTVPPASQIANPNPQPKTNNQYTQDVRFSNCSDVFNAPGVLPIVRYLNSLPYAVEANCDIGHYYMLNNTNPGFLPNGATADTTNGTAIPPSSVRTIGDALNDKSISWAYYGGAYNAAVARTGNPLARIRQCRLARPIATSATSSLTPRRSWGTRHSARRTSRTPPISTRQSGTAPCRRCRSSSPTGCSTVIRPRRNSFSLKACCKRSSIRSTAIPS